MESVQWSETAPSAYRVIHVPGKEGGRKGGKEGGRKGGKEGGRKGGKEEGGREGQGEEEQDHYPEVKYHFIPPQYQPTSSP